MRFLIKDKNGGAVKKDYAVVFLSAFNFSKVVFYKKSRFAAMENPTRKMSDKDANMKNPPIDAEKLMLSAHEMQKSSAK